jgi:hypothetical protein
MRDINDIIRTEQIRREYLDRAEMVKCECCGARLWLREGHALDCPALPSRLRRSNVR